MKPTEGMADALYACLAQDFGVDLTLEEAQVSLERVLRDVPEPSHTVAELNKRVTALKLRLARVEAVLTMTRKLTPEVSAMCEQLAYALNGDDPP